MDKDTWMRERFADERFHLIPPDFYIDAHDLDAVFEELYAALAASEARQRALREYLLSLAERLEAHPIGPSLGEWKIIDEVRDLLATAATTQKALARDS